MNAFLERVANSSPLDGLATLLAALRALGWVHLAHHWQTRGPVSYSDHLMFERLYNGIVPEIDSLAERCVGLAGFESVDPLVQIGSVASFVRNWRAGVAGMGPDMYVAVSLGAERDFLKLTNVVAELTKSDKNLSRGTDNLLADIEDNHESHVYLLQQRSAVG